MLLLTACQPKYDGRYSVYIDGEWFTTFTTQEGYETWLISEENDQICLTYQNEESTKFCVDKEDIVIERIGDTFDLTP